MGARKWQPGDVAMVLNEYGVWNRAICSVKPGGDVWQYGVADSTVPMGAEARPLVVIDPEDREQVQNLRDLVDYAFNDVRYDGGGPTSTDLIQAALRNLASPKPEEPTGLGAVVEDAEGQLWCRHEQVALAGMHWHRVGANSSAKWSAVDAIKVLSEGVTP